MPLGVLEGKMLVGMQRHTPMDAGACTVLRSGASLKMETVQRQIIRRTLSIKKTDNGIGRYFVQCSTQFCEKRMISRKIPDLYHTLAKNSKVPFVRDNNKLLTSQEWAVIEKEVRSENGRRAIQGAVSSIANQMKEETGVMPTLKAAASELGSRGNEETLLTK